MTSIPVTDLTEFQVVVADGSHAVYAEEISFRLAADMPPPAAQALVKQACADAVAQDCQLVDLIAQRFPAIDWREVVDPAQQLGEAPAQARSFAGQARAMVSGQNKQENSGIGK